MNKFKKMCLSAGFVAAAFVNMQQASASTQAGYDPSEPITTSAQQQTQGLCLPCVFNAIDISQAENLYWKLIAIDTLSEQNILRFFDFIVNDNNAESSRAQMAYHLTTLVALGPVINDTLEVADYDWVLESDTSTADNREADNLYAFFGKPTNSNLRQVIWTAMQEAGFVTSDVLDVSKEYYKPSSALCTLVNPKIGIDIIIGGNSIPVMPGAWLDPKHQNNYGALDVHAYPSSSYNQEHLNAINIGVDHRHRPSVLANALDKNLWEDIEAHRISKIYVDDYDLKDRLLIVLPPSLRSKVIEKHL
jgi:hypothetical protein